MSFLITKWFWTKIKLNSSKCLVHQDVTTMLFMWMYLYIVETKRYLKNSLKRGVKYTPVRKQ